MGGNALKTVRTRRLPAAEYRLLAGGIRENLRLAIGRAPVQEGIHVPDRLIAEINSYRDKPDFGDLDVLVENDTLPPDWIEQIRCAFDPMEMVKNGETLSFDVDEFQVDIITVPRRSFAFATGYFGWNDLGNLLGRVAKSLGFKLGHRGFFYPLRDGTHLAEEVEVSLDFPRVLEFLGYDAARHAAGFDTLEDIFRYAASSQFFRKEIYLLENLNHTARVRDRKRSTYMSFLVWLEDALVRSGPPEDRGAHLARARDFFPGFGDRLDAARKQMEESAVIREKFNGEVASRISGFEGKELGALMRSIRESFPCDNSRRKYFLAASTAEIEGLVLKFCVEAAE